MYTDGDHCLNQATCFGIPGQCGTTATDTELRILGPTDDRQQQIFGISFVYIN